MLGIMQRIQNIATLFQVAAFSTAAAAAFCAQAEVATGIDADAGLPYWELSEPGMSVRLVQRHPDQTRAFFLARGFSREDVELIAQSCVFQTIVRNTAPVTSSTTLEYDLSAWRVQIADEALVMKSREIWAKIWAEREIAKPARIAFEWALLPTRQRYNPGDYNWGMSVFGLRPNSHFDLALNWTQSGKPHTAVIRGIHCAADVLPKEEAQ